MLEQNRPEDLCDMLRRMPPRLARIEVIASRLLAGLLANRNCSHMSTTDLVSDAVTHAELLIHEAESREAERIRLVVEREHQHRSETKGQQEK